MNYTEEQVKKILAQDPFDGDMDIAPRFLKNKMGTARKYSQCRNCLTNIHPGDMCRIMTVAFPDGDGILHGKYCLKCCDAILADNDGEAFADRFTREPRPKGKGE